ncbi:hypothetical protein [Hymenobacter coccineus]|uniref:Uncharacterized protein n=1 Tax=Hymenobacter coccineus TaxID=1908235 RepID=A0A1G1TKD1_9BACT|nr:hypothetical protein [Hymenobacter coccineus]OGX91312.1 hypothetical protein BEN49_20220 [Hymenobacter coccineus]
MQWLLRVCLAEPDAGLRMGLLGTLLLFEAPLLVAGLLGASGNSLIFCVWVSSSWLSGALWATWRLLRAEQLAATLESAD